MNENQYFFFVQDVYLLIQKELELYATEKKDALPEMYPKLVIMVEFFRQLRGEAFINVRPPTPNYQDRMYAMEKELTDTLSEIQKTLDPNDERTVYCIRTMQKAFEIQ